MNKRKRKQRRQYCKIVFPVMMLCMLLALCRLGSSDRKEPTGIKGVTVIAQPLEQLFESADKETGDDGEAELSVDRMLDYIRNHPEQYTEALTELAEKNAEAVEFVYYYPVEGAIDVTIDLSEEAFSDTVPLLLQWDSRWGYCKYGSGMIGYTGCGPTCLSMVSLFLTNDNRYTPKYIAECAEREGYYVQGSGTSWELMSVGCRMFGLKATELTLDESVITAALDKGRPVICVMGRGDFTDSGHFIVITGYDSEGFCINDPNSRERSKKRWEFSQIKWQIRNLWAFQARQE